MTFTGRRPTGVGRSILNGLAALGTAMADGPKLVRIEEIDKQVADLLQERDHLIADLIEPGDLKVSKNYDPNWRKPVVEDDEPFQSSLSAFSGEGRLTECKGRRTTSTYHDAHPGCPYVGQIHNAHEFTLRD